MADLDSIQKRESGFGVGLSFTRTYPTADGSDADSTDERAHLVMNYNGIDAGEPIILFLTAKALTQAITAGGAINTVSGGSATSTIGI